MACTLYWPSLLIQDDAHSKPYHIAMSVACMNFDRAKEVINEGRKNYRVLSAWIDVFDEHENKTTVFHQCYVNSVGNIVDVRTE